MRTDHIIFGTVLGNNFGAHHGAWRMPHVDPSSYTNIDATLQQARAAERGGLQFIFLPDRLFLHDDLATSAPTFNMDPIVTLAALVHGTRRIGLVGTASTSFTEPYLLARQLKVLDVISHGRAGWNAVPSYEPDAFANFGRQLPPREKKYERLHEAMQVVHALWGSWERGAGQPDQAGMYADPAHIRPVDLQGRHVGARGPLPVPPSEQGQPVVVMPLSSGYGLQAAGMYADVVIAMPMSVEEGRAQRLAVREAARQAGRGPDDIKFVVFAGVTVGHTRRAALDKRRALDDRIDIRGPLARLGAVLGLRQPFERPDEPLDSALVDALQPRPNDARSLRAVELAKAGHTPRDILAHAVLDPYPALVGTAEQAAGFLQAWFEAEAADGFMMCFDDFHTDIDAFVDHVVPLLRERGLFLGNEQAMTLRGNLGIGWNPGQGASIRTTKA